MHAGIFGTRKKRPSGPRRQPRSLRVRNLAAALDEFLRAPSSENGLSNAELVVRHLGTKGIDLVDPPSFDPVALKYERRVHTFRQAFRACWGGSRDWRKFDLATLRACDNLGALELPPRVEAAIAAEEEAEERAAIQDEAAGAYDNVETPFFDEEFAPPLEIRSSRRRKRQGVRRARLRRGRRSAVKRRESRKRGPARSRRRGKVVRKRGRKVVSRRGRKPRAGRRRRRVSRRTAIKRALAALRRLIREAGTE